MLKRDKVPPGEKPVWLSVCSACQIPCEVEVEDWPYEGAESSDCCGQPVQWLSGDGLEEYLKEWD